MKYTLVLVAFFCFATKNINAQDSAKAMTGVIEMKQYFFVMLINGKNRNQDSVSAAMIQEGHMANITWLHNIGKIIVAGPFGDEGEWRGIFIFDCKTEQEVQGYLKTDPAIMAGRLNYEIRPWWTAKNCVFH
jgi:uncharacterized protein YciI